MAALARAARIEDMVRRGLGRAAIVLGPVAEVYRPASVNLAPLSLSNLVLRMPAAFAPHGGSWAKPQGYGQALWDGLFDGAYTRPGDYIVRKESSTGAGDGGIWFIAAQQKLLPPLCVRASRVVTFTRTAPAATAGVNGYGGVTTQPRTTVVSAWPASVLDSGVGGKYQADLPTDTSLGDWSVLMPAVPAAVLRAGDFMADDLGRSGVVAAAELSELGWRLNVKQAAT
jgi:hypothetical protein